MASRGSDQARAATDACRVHHTKCSLAAGLLAERGRRPREPFDGEHVDFSQRLGLYRSPLLSRPGLRLIRLRLAKPVQALSSTWTGGEWGEAGSLLVGVTLETGVWR
jgi:hypothetical protein